MGNISTFFRMLRSLLPRLGLARRVVVIGLYCIIGFLAVLSIPLVSISLMDSLQVFPPITQSQLNEALSGPPYAIVILSAGRRAYAPEYGDETIDALTLERVRYGALLARRTGLPVLVSGFGVGPKEPPLAQLMATALLQDYGIRARWLETRSSNTAENAIYSSEILRHAGITHIILVTHAWHMPRAVAAFEANGISVIPAPTAFYAPTMGNIGAELVPSFEAFRMSGYAIHEIIGRAWYRLHYGYQ